MKLRLALALSAAALATACTTTSGPVSVTRFHLDQVGRGSVAVEPLTGGSTPPSLEFQTYAAAVQGELLRTGFGTQPGTGLAEYLAIVGFTRTTAEGPPRESPVSIGLGGGGYSGGRRGGGIGLGGGFSFPLGHSRPREVIATRLSVQIRRRSDGTVVWEGRAQTFADSRSPQAAAGTAAGRLAHALFLGFPGETGRTISVP